MIQSNNLSSFSFREVTPEVWPDLEELFTLPGAPKYCWCMTWRETAAEFKKADGQIRKSALKKRVDEGIPIGIVGYLDEKPVAWCSIAPRSTYKRLKGLEDEDEENVWSIACFYIVKELRGRGMTRKLIEAAVDTARQHGATIVEAYPVDPDSPSYRFMGYAETFINAGFEKAGRAGLRRHIMRWRIAGRSA
jgi:GNAT superfamily N-acetyltransferase